MLGATKGNMSHPVIIVEYDPSWPTLFEDEKRRILKAVGHKVVAVEQIGSTAVPNLGAKPIIDIMVAVPHLSDAAECVEPLKSIGYEYVPEHEASIPERRYFRKGPHGVPNQHYHLHMVELGSDFWRRHLLFRDFLRDHPEVAQQYYELKKRLAAEYGSDSDDYTAAKTSFIESVVTQARQRVASSSTGGL